jgi:hypothetical protein
MPFMPWLTWRQRNKRRFNTANANKDDQSHQLASSPVSNVTTIASEETTLSQHNEEPTTSMQRLEATLATTITPSTPDISRNNNIDDHKSMATTKKKHLVDEHTLRHYAQYSLEGIGVHDYERVPYIRIWTFGAPAEENRGICYLCNEHFISYGRSSSHSRAKSKLENHVRTKAHESRYEQLVSAQPICVEEATTSRVNKSQCLRQRANQLGLPRWRLHIMDLIKQYVEIPLARYSATSPMYEKLFRWRAITANLVQYEQMERLSLVELAFVKTKIMPLITASAESNDDLRKAAFVSCGLADIMPLVVQFLGKPVPIKEEDED